ncbi:hypothetical protein [Rhizobium sp. SRDI969]|nr:hypothetical protein [Rhizobium leguminosarum]UWM84961.1 hypothetical protein N2A41_29675 [Rhizobium leguminosarum bv. viciae]
MACKNGHFFEEPVNITGPDLSMIGDVAIVPIDRLWIVIIAGVSTILADT